MSDKFNYFLFFYVNNLFKPCLDTLLVFPLNLSKNELPVFYIIFEDIWYLRIIIFRKWAIYFEDYLYFIKIIKLKSIKINMLTNQINLFKVEFIIL